jgi:hypothetical protein
MAKDDSSKVWSALSLITYIGAAALARKALDKSWQISTGRKPPENPADPDVNLWEAVTWAAATGAAVALFRMAAQRRAANYYIKSTGHYPPGLGRDGQ